LVKINFTLRGVPSEALAANFLLNLLHYSRQGLPGFGPDEDVSLVVHRRITEVNDNQLGTSTGGIDRHVGSRVNHQSGANHDKQVTAMRTTSRFLQYFCWQCLTEKNNLQPDDIERIQVYSPPGLFAEHIESFKNKNIKNVIDGQFSIPFNLSLAAHRVPVGVEWQDLDTRKDPKILEFMDKVSVTAGYPGWEKEGPVLSRRTRIEVTAGGQTYIEDRAEARGSGSLEVPDEELEKKFRHNASRLLTEGKIKRATEALWNLEKVEFISELIDQLTL